jgi:hypothetical protein
MSGPRNLVFVGNAPGSGRLPELRARPGRRLLGRGRQVASLVTDAIQQFAEGCNELLNALTLERRDDIVVVDADGVELVEQVLRLVEIRLEPQLDPAVVLEGAIEKISKFGKGCARDAQRNERRARFWGGLHLTLGLPSAILAAVAGVSALGDLSGRTLSGVIALAAAALSATTAFLGDTARQRDSDAAATAFRVLATEAKNYVSVDAPEPHAKLDAPYLFRDFNERRDAVLAGQPLPPKWWKGQVAHASGNDDLGWLMD